DAVASRAEDEHRYVEHARAEVGPGQGVGKSTRSQELHEQDGYHGCGRNGKGERRETRFQGRPSQLNTTNQVPIRKVYIRPNGSSICRKGDNRVFSQKRAVVPFFC